MIPDLVVVVPHAGAPALLARALAAVGGRAPTLVVDDAAEPRDPSPRADHLLRLGGRSGFAVAANAGLACAARLGFAWAVLLNDDAAPLPGCLEALAARRRPALGAAGPVLLRPDGAVESAGLHHDPRWGRLRPLRRPPPAPRRVPALSGACLLLRTDERFDERYAHGFEDVALCHELAGRGLAIEVVPAARCRHAGGATVDRRSPEATRAALAGHLALLDGRPLARAGATLLAAAQLVREGAGPRRWGALLAGLRDGLAPPAAPARPPGRRPGRAPGAP